MDQSEIDRMAFPPEPILIANKRGRVVGYAPHRFFGGLEHLITTGGPKP